ncbi:MAG: CoA-binding protein [SAR324 cluster bacterium]|nr:CoA-binding protein [SAR324 cluster bacterium]
MLFTPAKAIDLIKENKKVAIIGLSPKDDRPSYHVGEFLIGHGLEITPVHPVHEEILGLKAVKNLSQLAPGQVDWIDIFLNPKRLMDLLPEILRLQPKLVWCQIGVVDEEFNSAILDAGINLIFNHCPKIEWS